MTLAEQNNGQAWRDCKDAGLRHLWRRREVHPSASARARERGRTEGWYVCVREGCRAGRFGKEVTS